MSDPRLTPARGDIAAASLRGVVDAKRYVDGAPQSCILGHTPLRAGPSTTAGIASEVVFGETFTVYARSDGWAWGQCARDLYVGYVSEAALSAPTTPTHRVIATSTVLLPAPDIKRPPLALLPMTAQIEVTGAEGSFARIAPRGFVFAAHLAPLAEVQSDAVATAERFLGAPYLWGGKTIAGLDCSGLVQIALQESGINAPRDSDQQEAALGTAIDLSQAQRGDLIFWKGHVAFVRDASTILHANAHSMNVSIENLNAAITRIARSGSAVTSVKRLQ